MKKPSKIKRNLLSLALVATLSGCATNYTRPSIGELESIDVNKFVGTEEQIEEYLQWANRRYRMKILEIYDENNIQVGLYGYGRMEGLHYREFSTNEKYLGEGRNGPKTLENERAILLSSD